LTPIRLVALSNLATTYLLSGKPEAAFETIQEAIQSAPQDNIGYRISGCLHLAHGEVELARSDWEEALSLAEDKQEAALIEGWLATLPSVQK
jgi:Tfp pilus assembly protein PilF